MTEPAKVDLKSMSVTDEQKAKLKQSKINLVDAEETALFELTKALLSIENTEEFVESQQLNITRAQEGNRLAEVGYKEGINTQVEVIDAGSALTKAMVLYYQAIYSHIIAKLDLQKAMGVLSPKLQDDAAAKSNAGVQGTQDSGKQVDKVTSQKTNVHETIESANGHAAGEPK